MKKSAIKSGGLLTGREALCRLNIKAKSSSAEKQLAKFGIRPLYWRPTGKGHTILVRAADVDAAWAKLTGSRSAAKPAARSVVRRAGVSLAPAALAVLAEVKAKVDQLAEMAGVTA